MTYDGSHNLIGWVNPLGDRTSFTYSTQRVVATTPLGAVTTVVNELVTGGGELRPRSDATSVTVVTNPLGQVTSLGYIGQALVNATDALGNTTTYNWDVANRLLSIGDGLGAVTSFGYVQVFPNKISYLSSIKQPLGGIFTYTYSSFAATKGLAMGELRLAA